MSNQDNNINQVESINDNNDDNKNKISKGENNINKNIDKVEILKVPNNYSDYEIHFKVIVIGNSGVGKTCITNKAIKNDFNNNYITTIGMEIYSLFIKINNKTIKLQIWDTCGQEIYRSLIVNFYRSTSLAILVYSINNKDSFRDIDLWVKELKSNNSPDTKLILVGNKLDLQDKREISYEEGKKFAKDFGFIDFFETSAKTGENVQTMFKKAAMLLYEEHLKYKEMSENTSFNSFKPSMYKTKEIKRTKCC
jgi:small GTP-binding protein